MMLLKNKAARFIRDVEFKTAIAVATARGHAAIAALIDADPLCVHIHDMAREGKILMVSSLLKQGCPLNYRDERKGNLHQTPLMAASSAGKADVVRMLLVLIFLLTFVNFFFLIYLRLHFSRGRRQSSARSTTKMMTAVPH